MKCEDCAYYWQEENESRPMCHFHAMSDWDKSPCEYSDRKEIIGTDEEGYDICG